MASARTLVARTQSLLRVRLKLGRASRGGRAPLQRKLAATKGQQSPLSTRQSIVPIGARPRSSNPAGHGTPLDSDFPTSLFDSTSVADPAPEAFPLPRMPPPLSAISPFSQRSSSLNSAAVPKFLDTRSSPVTPRARRRSRASAESPGSGGAQTMPLMAAVTGPVVPTFSNLPLRGTAAIANRSGADHANRQPSANYLVPPSYSTQSTTSTELTYQPADLVLPTTIPGPRQPPGVTADEARRNMPELPVPLAPAANTAPHGSAGAPGPTQGTIYLDGNALGQWLTSHLEQTMSHPNRGPSGVDPRVFPVWGPISAAY